jgi:hypothetical protein
VAKEAAGVGEALNLVTAGFEAFVRAIMFIHMFAGVGVSGCTVARRGGICHWYLLPFARTTECGRRLLTINMVAEDLAF